MYLCLSSFTVIFSVLEKVQDSGGIIFGISLRCSVCDLVAGLKHYPNSVGPRFPLQCCSRWGDQPLVVYLPLSWNLMLPWSEESGISVESRRNVILPRSTMLARARLLWGPPHACRSGQPSCSGGGRKEGEGSWHGRAVLLSRSLKSGVILVIQRRQYRTQMVCGHWAMSIFYHKPLLLATLNSTLSYIHRQCHFTACCIVVNVLRQSTSCIC